jgi:hypothetical protein
VRNSCRQPGGHQNAGACDEYSAWYTFKSRHPGHDGIASRPTVSRTPASANQTHFIFWGVIAIGSASKTIVGLTSAAYFVLSKLYPV